MRETIGSRFGSVWRGLAAVALATAGAVMLGAPPAGAASPGLCNLLPTLCPTTTTPKATPPTTKAPSTTGATAAPTTHPATTARSTATTGVRRAPVQPALGATGLPAPVNLPVLGGGDPTAPVLANSPTASTNPVVYAPLLPGLVGTAQSSSHGLADHHSTLRIVFSLLVLVIAGVAIGQAPASRRRPRPAPPAS